MSNQSQESKRGLQLDRVVLLGRTFEEYRRYFLLESDNLVGKKVLDVAGGSVRFALRRTTSELRSLRSTRSIRSPERKSGNDPIRILNPFTDRSDSCRRIAGVFTKIRS